MPLAWRPLLASTAVGCGLAASLWRCNDVKCWLGAKGVPADPLEEVLIKGYACHPRSAKIATILLYYDIPFQVSILLRE